MNIFFLYDQYGNITQASDSYPSSVIPPCQLLVCDINTPNAQQALAQKDHYMVQNGQILPAATIHIDRTQAQQGAFFIWTLSITTSDATDHQLNLSILNNSQTIDVPATGTTIQVAVHQSVNNAHVPVIASGSGLITQETFIGGNDSSIQLQSYKDANGLLHIAPTSKSFLSNYWTSQAVNTAYSAADIGTWLSMLLQTVYGIMLPALTSGTTPLVTLDANQANTVSDIKANLLPNLLTTLENAAPVPAAGASQSYDLHYAHSVHTFAATKTAMDNYVNDLQTIPNLV